MTRNLEKAGRSSDFKGPINSYPSIVLNILIKLEQWSSEPPHDKLEWNDKG